MRDFRDFCILYRLEPWDLRRGDIWLALLCDVIQKTVGNKQSKPEHYLPFQEKPTQTQDDVLASLTALGRHLTPNGKA